MKYEIVCKWYEGNLYKENHVRKTQRHEVELGKNSAHVFGEGICFATIEWKTEEHGMKGKLLTHFTQQCEYPVSISFACVDEEWERDNYAFAPAAVYDGNRMKSIPLPYPPYCDDKNFIREAVIADIPRLDKDKDSSVISFLAGDMSTPAIGYLNRKREKGFLLYGMQQSRGREIGYTIREDIGEKKGEFSISVPGVREENCYFFGEREDGSGFYPDTHAHSTDEGEIYNENEGDSISFRIYEFSAPNIIEYFRFFHSNRNCMELKKERIEVVPFSKAYMAVKEKYKKENFIELSSDEGYFSVGTNHTLPQQCWQAGWIGGGMNLLPFLYEDEKEYEMGIATFRFILDHLQNENGWIYGMYQEGCYYGDKFDQPENKDILLLRKNADILYFLLKEWMILKKKDAVRQEDENKIRALADAFVRLYKKHGQIGQFINIKTEEIIIGNCAGAAMAVGALALAYTVFQKEDYLNAAKELGDYYNKEYVQQGILNGGPGEICQAPDSESAFALLESYVQLYESTGEEKWIICAEDTFEIAATWVMSYHFCFPEKSTAGQRQVYSKGTVFANAQNKHSAPGICTLSGNCLLKLYRMTGKIRYLECLESIAHSLTQFVSVKENPVNTLSGVPLPEGYMNERVQTSDWEGKETVGEFLYGSNWPEVSMLLTYIEVPGIYIDFSNKVVKCFDHVECSSTFTSQESVVLELMNPTKYDASVTIFAEQTKTNMGHDYFENMKKIKIGAGRSEKITQCQ